MSRIRMLLINDGDEATLACAPAAVASLPVTHLQNPQRSRVMRVMGTSAIITGEFTGARVLSGVVLYRHNFSSTATWRVELFVGANQTGALVYDSGVVPAQPTLTLGELAFGIDPLVTSIFQNWELAYSVCWFALTAARSFRISISDPDNGVGYLDVQRLYVGRALEPEVNFNIGHQLQWVDESRRFRTEGGSLWTEPGPQYRRFSFKLEHLTPADRPHFVEATRRVGTRKDFFVSAYPEQGGALERDYAMAGRFVDVPEFEGQVLRHLAGFEVEEV